MNSIKSYALLMYSSKNPEIKYKWPSCSQCLVLYPCTPACPRTPVDPGLPSSLVQLQACDCERTGSSRAPFPACCFWEWLVTRSPFTTCFSHQAASISCCTSSQPWACLPQALPVLKPQVQVSAVGCGSPSVSENNIWTLCLLLMRSLS